MRAASQAVVVLALVLGAVGQTFGGETPAFEFLGVRRGATEKAALVFEVKATAQRMSEDLHTVYSARAVVLESTVASLEKGTVFEAYFDRWYSIFDAPAEHPLKIGDRVEVGVTDVTDHTISAFLKKKQPANKMPDPTAERVTPRADARGAPLSAAGHH